MRYNAYREEVAGYGFAEFYLPLFPGFFYAAFNNAQFIRITIYTYAAIYGRGNEAIFRIRSVRALPFYFLYIVGMEVRFYFRVDPGYDLCLFFSKWRTAVAIYT